MIKDNTEDFMDTEPIPQNEGNEWFKNINGISHKPQPALAKVKPKYAYPVQVSSRQQRGLNYG